MFQVLSIIMGTFLIISFEKAQTMQSNQAHKIQHKQEEVSYTNNAEGITLSGTLTIPDSANETFPAVVLIAGYGPNDRDVTGMGHKYFKVLAEHLTSQGIAVLRYDKRGVGKSTGNWANVTSKELAQDVLAGIEYLKTRSEINKNQIGLIGLSEGGLIATMVAAQSKDVNFMVLMAPYIALGVDNIVYQAGLQLRVDGASEEFIAGDKSLRSAIYTIAQQEIDKQAAGQHIRDAIVHYWAKLPDSMKRESERLSWAFTEPKIDMYVNIVTSPAYHFYLNYDPRPILEAIKVPTLAIVGSLDMTTSPAKIFPILKKAFEISGHKEYTLIELPNLNHVFQTCQTGALSEYATIKETMAPVALYTISAWVTKTITKHEKNS